MIQRIALTEVRVPAREGAIRDVGHGPPLHKIPQKGTPAWKLEFDQLTKWIVELTLENGVTGLGESYRGVDRETMMNLARSLVGRSVEGLPLDHLPFGQSREYDAFECALYDAYGRCHDLPLHDLIGGRKRDRVLVSAWSGPRSPDSLLSVAAEYRGRGYTYLKLKCNLEDDVAAWSGKLRQELGTEMQLILDPNERWESYKDALRRVRELEPLGNVYCIEDPFPRNALQDYAALRELTTIYVARHIALPYFMDGHREADVLQSAQAGAADGFNFNGGIAAVHRMSVVAEMINAPFWHGSEIDLGILEARYLHLCAAASRCVWPSDIFGRLIREHDLLEEPLQIEPPFATVPDGPGLGVTVDRDALERYALAKEVIEV